MLLAVKVCKMCRQELPISSFYLAKSASDGHVSFCKKCYLEKRRGSQADKKWRENNKDRLKKQAAQWAIENKEKRAAYSKKYWEDNKKRIRTLRQGFYYLDIEKSRDLLRLRYAKDIQSRLYNSAKRRAKARGLNFDIEKDDIIVPECCPVFGIRLCIGDGAPVASSYSLDRIDPSKGYVKGNVIVVSYKVNTMKSNGTIEELEKIVTFYKQLLVGGD